MKNTIILACLGLLLCGCATTSRQEESRVKLEFKAVEKEAGEGLTEMVIQGSDEKIFVTKNALLTHVDIATAKLKIEENQTAQIEIVFTQEGKNKFSDVTRILIGKRLAIIIDGKVITAPTIMDRIVGGRAVITGSFSTDEAQRIVDGLNRKQK